MEPFPKGIANVDYFVTYNRRFKESKAKGSIKVIAQGELVRLLGTEPKDTEVLTQTSWATPSISPYIGML